MSSLTNPAKWSNYSYTFATGRKPEPQFGSEHTWFKHEYSHEKSEWFLPPAIFDRISGGRPNTLGWVDYPTYFDAIAAANDAARRAIADGVWKPEAA